jgi:hypothetical protein
MLLASSPHARLNNVTAAECQRILASSNTPTLDRDTIRAEILAMTAILSRAEDSSVLKPMFSSTNNKIGLARDPALSKLDPIEAALECLGQLQVKNRLPSPEEAAGINAIIVEAQSASATGFSAQALSALKSGAKKLSIFWLVQHGDKNSAPSDPRLPQPTPMPIQLEVLAKSITAPSKTASLAA